MDSPLCRSVSSEAFPQSVSEDSGLLLSGDSSPLVPGLGHSSMEQESDADDKSSLLDDSLAYSDIMCGDGFNTLKKGPVICNQACEQSYDLLTDPESWTESLAIKPPPEFQDASPLTGTPRVSPHITPARLASVHKLRRARLRPDVPEWLEKMAIRLVTQVLEDALQISGAVSWSIHCSEDCHPRRHSEDGYRNLLSVPNTLPTSGLRLCWTPELPYTLCRPASRSSLASRLSSSHNSLSVPAANRVDDSSFITSAMSHEVLSTGDISDMYNVPVDCDVYAVPVDVVRPQQPLPLPPQRPKRQRPTRRKRKHASNAEFDSSKGRTMSSQTMCRPQVLVPEPGGGKRHSRPGRSASMECTTPGEPIHMTLQEVRRYLSSLYSSSSDSSEYRKKRTSVSHIHHRSLKSTVGDGLMSAEGVDVDATLCNNNTILKSNRKSTFTINIKNKKSKEVSPLMSMASPVSSECMAIPEPKPKRGLSFSSTLKQTFCNMFRFRRVSSPEHVVSSRKGVCDLDGESDPTSGSPQHRPRFSKRALPPLPAREMGGAEAPNVDSLPSPEESSVLSQSDPPGEPEPSVDFASSIEKVKDYGWYWGPISGEAAEKILSNEPDGSFIVRDSSDDHYIFSLTFKLNSCVRHVRIEQDQGNFSFGSCTKFKSHTIVEFIENAVEHSRSGRYLFFLHRRPVLGPMRVQLLHPVSRFKQVQSLQHMCRFVILKVVRRDLISTLPLPRRVIDYLNTPHYYSEQLAEEEPAAPPSSISPSVEKGLFPYAPFGYVG